MLAPLWPLKVTWCAIDLQRLVDLHFEDGTNRWQWKKTVSLANIFGKYCGKDTKNNNNLVLANAKKQ